VKPDGYIPPPPGWAAAAARAAGSSSSSAPGGEGDEDDMGLDPEFLEEMIASGANLAVELQLLFQAWIIKKRLELTAGAVPEEGKKAKARIVGAKIWAKELRRALPTDLPMIPGWIAAPLMVAAYGLPVQIGDAVPIKPSAPGTDVPETPQPKADPAPASADGPPGEAI